jgi:F-type H+-transporting ATPase subunit a
VAEQKRKGCLGCSFPLAIGLTVIVLALVVVGVIAGPLGKSLFPSVHLPGWLSVPTPEISLPADVVFHVGPLAITNTMVATWITFVVLILASVLITRRMKLVPGRMQAAFEFLLGWLYDFCTSAAGEKNGRRFFPLVATIFLFVSFNAWLGLLPGYSAITIHTGEGAAHLIRPANTDLNTTLAIAIVAVIAVQITGLTAVGPGYFKKFFNVHGLTEFLRGGKQIVTGKFIDGLSTALTGIVEMFIGVLEFLSEFVIRLISFTFRLFGNMTAGEVLLLVALFLVPMVVALPFYLLELLVGFLQAIIFAGLTLIFLDISVASHEEEHASH